MLDLKTTIDDVLYPKIEANETGMLQVSDLHQIHWERSGNPEGIPVIVIHGGPGGGSQPSYRRYFNPNKYEEKIIRKIFQWPKIIESAAYKLEPHKIPFYLYELSTIFHSYWSKGNEDSKFRLIQDGKIKKEDSLAYIFLVAIVIKNGMNILGVSLPEKM